MTYLIKKILGGFLKYSLPILILVQANPVSAQRIKTVKGKSLQGHYKYNDSIDSIHQIKEDEDKYYYFYKGIEFYLRSMYVPARECFERVISLNDSNDAAYAYLSRIAFINNNEKDGIKFLKMAIKRDSVNYWYKNELSSYYMKKRDFGNAVSILKKMTEEFKGKPEIYYNLFYIYASTGNTEKAGRTLDSIEQIMGKNEDTAEKRLSLFQMKHDYKGALDYLLSYDRKEKSAKIETMIGDLYNSSNNDSAAIRYYNAALDKEPSYLPALYKRAEFYRASSDYPNFFESVYPVFSNPEIPVEFKSEYLRQIFKTSGFITTQYRKQSDSLVSAYLNSNPADSSANYISAGYFSEMGDKKRAAIILKNYNALVSNETTATHYLSFIYYTKDWPLLEKEAGKASERYPHSAGLLELYGEAQAMNGNYHGAIINFSKLEKFYHSQKDTEHLKQIYSVLGDAYHSIKENRKAYSYYKKALKIDPYFALVLNNYAYDLTLDKKQLKKACEMARIAVEKEPDNPSFLDTYAWALHTSGNSLDAKAHMRHAMLYGGDKSFTILDHYAEILFALKEYDLAFIYWEKALPLDKDNILPAKIKLRKGQRTRQEAAKK
ncbi:MAG: tetratricopeptide repeat protein [Bacteroidales bacterium]|jgi:tetratricopeptide (TPR) repeat protein|nr:tetratricopeptide repeat protein [Bacteroidales bacterium]